jgi:hypothetical protein
VERVYQLALVVHIFSAIVLVGSMLELATVALGCLEADRLAFLSAAPVEAPILDAFSPDLVVGAGGVDARRTAARGSGCPLRDELGLPAPGTPEGP